MSLTIGTRLGPYDILAPLGAGGMNEVYKARDTRLGREVAVKTLRPEVAGDPDRRARFEREARAIGAITHPHICTLHDVGRARVTTAGRLDEDIDFLVMELLEGETLADRLSRGRLGLAQSLELAMQIADALDHAHRQGIVHRDLKPSNIMLTRAGAKLLDFGLARLRSEHDPLVEAVTLTVPLTATGIILGTLQYIAPEQLEGREVDSRADLFAFGAIIHEMATGCLAFDAPSSAGLISAILHAQPPPLSSLNPSAPPELGRLVTVCLAKNPDDRWSSAHDLLLMLKGIADTTGPGSAQAAVRDHRRRETIAWAAAVAATVLAALFPLRGGAPIGPAPVDVVSILPPNDTSLTSGEAPQVSPDGRRIALVATDRSGRTLLYVRDRESSNARPLPGTDEATLPFWAPDGASLGFFAGGRLKRIAVSGGAPQTLAVAPVPRGGTWNRDDIILFAPYPGQPLNRIAAAGGVATPLPVAVPETRWFPTFLPDGRHYVYLTLGSNRVGRALRVASIDSTETKDLLASKATAAYVEPGYLMFRREESLVAQRLDLDTLDLKGAPITIVEKVGFNPITYQTLFSASASGVLAYFGAMPGAQLVWFDRLGRRLGPATSTGVYNSLCFCAGGKRVVYDAADGSGNVDIWSLDLPDGKPERLTFDPAVDFYAVCSTSTDDVVFASLRGGVPNLYRQNTSAPGSERLLLPSPLAAIPTDWSRDGRWIVYASFSPKTSWDIWVLPLGGEPFAFAATEAEERNARLSPDGRWMAYTSEQGESFDVYVQPFPATGSKWQVSRGGGRQPVWRPDGHGLFYISPDKRIVAVDVTTSGATFLAGAARMVVDTPVVGWERTNQGSPYAVTPDGERFLVSTAAETALPVTTVFNWPLMLPPK